MDTPPKFRLVTETRPLPAEFGLTNKEIVEYPARRAQFEKSWNCRRPQRPSSLPEKIIPGFDAFQAFCRAVGLTWILFIIHFSLALIVARAVNGNFYYCWAALVGMFVLFFYVRAEAKHSRNVKAQMEYETSLAQFEREVREARVDFEFLNRPIVKFLAAVDSFEKKQKEKAERAFRKQQADFLNSLAFWNSLNGKGREFEVEISKLFKRMEFSINLTPESGDGGVDIVASKGGLNYVIQCKAHEAAVGIAPFRELYGVREDFNADALLMITLNGAAKTAADWANKKGIKIWTARDICEVSQGRAVMAKDGAVVRSQKSNREAYGSAKKETDIEELLRYYRSRLARG